MRKDVEAVVYEIVRAQIDYQHAMERVEECRDELRIAEAAMADVEKRRQAKCQQLADMTVEVSLCKTK